MKRLPKVPEPPRPKGHWDYLCEEMQWLSADFAQERRWKRGVARKVGHLLGVPSSISFPDFLFLDKWVGLKGTKQNKQYSVLIHAHSFRRQALTSQISWP